MSESDWTALSMNIAMMLGSTVTAVCGIIAFRVGRNIGRREGSTESRVIAARAAGFQDGARNTKPLPGNQSKRHREAHQ